MNDPNFKGIHDDLLRRYVATLATSGAVRASRNLRRELTEQSPEVGLKCASILAQSGETEAALALIEWLFSRSPNSPNLRFEFGEQLRRNNNFARAKQVLIPLTEEGHSAAIEGFAAILQMEGKLTAAAEAIVGLQKSDPGNLETTLARIKFAGRCQRPKLAYELCLEALYQYPNDTSLQKRAGLIAASLGQFDAARRHYLTALDSAGDQEIPSLLHALSFSQRYGDADHEDIRRYRRFLASASRAPLDRASVLFALGKASDDIGNYESAATHFREGNALIRKALTWSTESWNSDVDDCISGTPRTRTFLKPEITPIFIVGLPRSGTTLIADRLGRLPNIRNRGELNLVPYLEKWQRRLSLAERQKMLVPMSSFAMAHLRQDDAPNRWYIDKNPLNFRYLGLIDRLLPNSLIIYCRRNLKDTALSIWQQYFSRGNDNGYAYAFEDIAGFAAGCERLMKHWRNTLSVSIYPLDYEALIREPKETLSRLCNSLGLPNINSSQLVTSENAAVQTSSVWQVRQPIYTTSIDRWVHYERFVPELAALFPD